MRLNRWRTRVLRTIPLLLLLAAVSTGCTPESQILSGKWYSSGPISLDSEGDSLVNLEMVLGHYGPDVVGTIRLSHPPSPMDCSCGPLVLGEYRTGGLFRFFVTDAMSCLSGDGDFNPPADGLDLHIDVTLLEEELSGVVVLRYLESSTNMPIVFLRDETDPFISDQEKTCP